MQAWLLSRGIRWRPISAFVSPGRKWSGTPSLSVPSVVAVRFHGTLEVVDPLGTDLALELASGLVWPLRGCQVLARDVPDEWELVAELGPTPE